LSNLSENLPGTGVRRPVPGNEKIQWKYTVAIANISGMLCLQKDCKKLTARQAVTIEKERKS
jgi:hypothetical protein